MDEPVAPTATELGVSPGQYERILRDLQRRQEAGDAALAGPRPRTTARRPPSSRAWLVVLGVALGIFALLRLVGVDGGGSDPAYAFMRTAGDQPVTYSSCRPVQVAVYPAGGPANAEALVREAVAQLRADTGLDITVIGSFGGHAPNWNFQSSTATAEDPISVSWQDQESLAGMTEDLAGLGGSPYVATPSGGQRYVAGAIALSQPYYAQLAQQGWHDEELAILLHEFGHVFGLAHVHSRHELMNERNVGLTHFGPGDLQGLRLLGQGPCV
jgi:hypothetical protein